MPHQICIFWIFNVSHLTHVITLNNIILALIKFILVWLKSNLSLTPVYWYVKARHINKREQVRGLILIGLFYSDTISYAKFLYEMTPVFLYEMVSYVRNGLCTRTIHERQKQTESEMKGLILIRLVREMTWHLHKMT